MTSELRWRIMSLQAVMVIIFAIGAGFLFWASAYSHSTVTDELKAQQIVFPTKTNAEFKALPAVNQKAMAPYAGQTMTTGDQARTYANNFIKVHLGEMGMTYSQASLAAMTHPKNLKLQNLVATIFKGTTLRSMLLNAYGWWTVGTYAGLAAIVALLAAIGVCGAFLFELLVAMRKEGERSVARRSSRAQAVPVA